MPRTQFDAQMVEQPPNFAVGDVAVTRREQGLYLSQGKNELLIDEAGEDADFDIDADGAIHVAYVRQRAIVYCRCTLEPLHRVSDIVVALPFGRSPSIYVSEDCVIIAYLSDHLEPPADDELLWCDQPRDRRLGLGGRIAVVEIDKQGQITRHTVASSKQIIKPIWPKRDAFEYDYPNVDIRARMEIFGPPVLSRGADGVVTLLWVNLTRRWVYASRRLGNTYSPPTEVRGPHEALGPILTAPKRPKGEVVFTTQAKDRIYLHSLKSPPRVVDRELRIDFLQLDYLSVCRGLEQQVEPMRRSHSPVIAVNADEIGLAGNVHRDNDGNFVANLIYKRPGRRWRHLRPVVSKDGITFGQREAYSSDDVVLIDGNKVLKEDAKLFVLDDGDRSPRFKGLLQDDPDKIWGTLVPAWSEDGVNWTTLRDANYYPVCDGAYIWRDDTDIESRRYKAIGNARSWCGRVCAQFVSSDGIHWQDLRDTLDFHNPFDSEPYWHKSYGDGRGVGRILIDPWAGPDDEDEIHGGVVFRDGQRWLCHYMKWTCDGHIIPALASSNDGINFSRVAGGTPTLPLGDPGTWDSGRIVVGSPPILVDDIWRQYYVGSGWKHGMEGSGKKPHSTSGNVGPYSPMQIGFAETGVGRWCGLRLMRDVEEGELITVPLMFKGAHRFDFDVVNEQAVMCELLLSDGSRSELRRGDVIDLADPVCIAMRIRGGRAVLYGLTFQRL